MESTPRCRYNTCEYGCCKLPVHNIPSAILEVGGSLLRCSKLQFRCPWRTPHSTMNRFSKASSVCDHSNKSERPCSIALVRSVLCNWTFTCRRRPCCNKRRLRKAWTEWHRHSISGWLSWWRFHCSNPRSHRRKETLSLNKKNITSLTVLLAANHTSRFSGHNYKHKRIMFSCMGMRRNIRWDTVTERIHQVAILKQQPILSVRLALFRIIAQCLMSHGMLRKSKIGNLHGVQCENTLCCNWYTSIAIKIKIILI